MSTLISMPQLHPDSPLKPAVCLFWGRPTSPGPVWYLCILGLPPHRPRTGVVTRLAKNLASVVWAKLCSFCPNRSMSGLGRLWYSAMGRPSTWRSVIASPLYCKKVSKISFKMTCVTCAKNSAPRGPHFSGSLVQTERWLHPSGCQPGKKSTRKEYVRILHRIILHCILHCIIGINWSIMVVNPVAQYVGRYFQSSCSIRSCNMHSCYKRRYYVCGTNNFGILLSASLECYLMPNGEDVVKWFLKKFSFWPPLSSNKC